MSYVIGNSMHTHTTPHKCTNTRTRPHTCACTHARTHTHYIYKVVVCATGVGCIQQMQVGLGLLEQSRIKWCSCVIYLCEDGPNSTVQHALQTKGSSSQQVLRILLGMNGRPLTGGCFVTAYIQQRAQNGRHCQKVYTYFIRFRNILRRCRNATRSYMWSPSLYYI